MNRFYNFWKEQENIYFLNDYHDKEKNFSIVIPDYAELYFNRIGLQYSCMLDLYSHFEFSIIKEKKSIKTVNIEFLELCNMKKNCRNYSKLDACILKASEIFKD